jgi:folylpolyglutamate synthase
MKLGASGEPVNLSWQHSLRAVWDSHANGSSASKAASAPLAAGAAAAVAVPLPPLQAVAAPSPAAGLPADAAVAVQGSNGGCCGALAGRSAVLPSLQVTLDWLRRCVREAPSLRMQVLVTGSLYLVGDVLKALQQPQHQQPQQSHMGGSSTGGSSAAAAAATSSAMNGRPSQ